MLVLIDLNLKHRRGALVANLLKVTLIYPWPWNDLDLDIWPWPVTINKDLGPMKLILTLDLDMVTTYLHTKNEVPIWRVSNVTAWTTNNTDISYPHKRVVKNTCNPFWYNNVVFLNTNIYFITGRVCINMLWPHEINTGWLLLWPYI